MESPQIGGRLPRAERANILGAAGGRDGSPAAVMVWGMLIRNADPQHDAPACAAIYGPYVSGSAVSFEEQPPTVEETAARIGAAYAWVLAEHEGATLGYAYGSRH